MGGDILFPKFLVGFREWEEFEELVEYFDNQHF